jgi:hypothetical protein
MVSDGAESGGIMDDLSDSCRLVAVIPLMQQ